MAWSEKPYFSNLEALRGFCACLVALVHVPWANHFWYLSIVSQGWIFVDLFFVISGFVIAFNYFDTIKTFDDAASFMTKRFFRLYPLHIVTMIAMLCLLAMRELVSSAAGLHVFTHFDGSFLWAIISQLFLIHSLGVPVEDVLNSPSWSISTEFYAYVLFAMLCLLTPAMNYRIRLIAAGGLMGFVILIYVNGLDLRSTPQLGFARCVASFALGALSWAAYNKWPWRNSKNGFVCVYLLALGSLFIGLYFVVRHPGLTLLAPPLFSVLICALAQDRTSGFHFVLTTPLMLSLGELSYSIYMVHAFVGSIIGFALNRAFSGAVDIAGVNERLDVPLLIGDGATVLYLSLVIVVSGFTFSWVEAPCRAYGRRVAKPFSSLRSLTAENN